jgi:hypothetical protein
MTSSYSSQLRVELPATGDQPTTWGNTTNNNLGTLLEAAITGVASVTMPSDADYTLTVANGSTDEARRAVLYVSSGVSLTSTRAIVVPSVAKIYWVFNATSGSQNIIFRTASAAGSASVPVGYFAKVYCDGTNCSLMTPPTTAAGAVAVLGTLTAPNVGVTGYVTATGGFSGPLVGNVTGNVTGSITAARRASGGYVNVGNETNGMYSDSANVLGFQAGGVYAGSFDNSGNLYVQGNVSWSSDAALKEDIRPMTGGLKRALRMKPSTYRRKDTGKRQLGVIAQDVKAAHPLAASADARGVLAAHGGAIDAILLGAVHDLAAEVSKLRGEVKAIKRGG